MNKKPPPESIWIDARVAATLSPERDPAAIHPQVQYMLTEVASRLLKDYREQITRLEFERDIAKTETSPEKWVQAELVVQVLSRQYQDGPEILVLTNFGRMFEEISPGQWSPYQGPSLGPRS